MYPILKNKFNKYYDEFSLWVFGTSVYSYVVIKFVHIPALVFLNVLGLIKAFSISKTYLEEMKKLPEGFEDFKPKPEKRHIVLLTASLILSILYAKEFWHVFVSK